MPVGVTGHHQVAGLQRAVLDQERGNHALGLVQLRFDHRANDAALGVGADVGVIRYQQDGLQQILDALFLLGRNRYDECLPAPFVRDEVVVAELALHHVEVGVGLVYLVQGHDDGHARRPGVGDGFLGLGHHAVVRSHDQDDDIRTLCAARPHGGKSRVAGRIQESDGATVVLDLVRPDVLGDAARLAFGHVGVAYGVQERGLAVVYVAQDGHDRWARGQQRLVLIGDHPPPERYFAAFFFLGNFPILRDCLVAHFGGDDGRGIEVNLLIDIGHYAIGHQAFNDLDCAGINIRC